MKTAKNSDEVKSFVCLNKLMIVRIEDIYF